MGNLLNHSSLQGWLKRDVPNAPLWCSVGSLLTVWTSCAADSGQALRTCAVIVYNLRAVTNRIPYQTSRVFPLTPHARSPSPRHPHAPTSTPFAAPRTAPRICAPHALRITSHAHAYRALTRHARTTRFSLPIFTFLLPSYHATLWLPTSVQPQPHYQHETKHPIH